MIKKTFSCLLVLVFLTSMFSESEHVEKFFSLMHILFP